MTQKSYIMPVLAALTQFYQMKLAIPPIKKQDMGNTFKDNLARSMNVQMRYVMPFSYFYRPEAFFRHRPLLDDDEYFLL